MNDATRIPGPRAWDSPCDPTLAVQPFSRSAVQPFSRSAVRPFSRSPGEVRRTSSAVASGRP
ncbi:hypothetical protein D5H75_31665 [Bailinhaonella thermotolerans]|uniref:Uncharacterized protein n=1 Tax=Bailinhaonella thermotolerans TaxID=1070861 RepID=A0A3A4AX32_9ACTN|nr:hypothetical protein D5H75_31665 [Bailinhaonella thermotolerans]